MDVWNLVKDKISPGVLSGELIRVVESQEQIATNQLVDNLEEQIQLEELLEQSKPVLTSNKKNKPLSYLLSTPFRYPPLLHGSRFGSRFEPSLFYASKSIKTAFAETAFYRFYFWAGMSIAPPSGKYITEHIIFTAKYYSENGLALNKAPFTEFEKQLRDPCHYKITQKLGSKMRENKIDIFEYYSARDKIENLTKGNNGINIALFNPSAFTNKKPKEQQQWLCETTANRVSFSSKEGDLYSYEIERFLVDSIFPLPAA